MFDTALIFLMICVYVSILFWVAYRVERKSLQGKKPADNAIVYSLSLAIYCTSWTFYGSVGVAASSGFLFLAIYIGPTLAIILWSRVLRKLIKIKQSQRINSIADFIAARYNRSQPLAAMVTVITLIGIAPYIALQFRAIISTFNLITTRVDGGNHQLFSYTEPMIALLLITFTILLGVRRLDPTERHQGMIVAVALESVVKLAAFLSVGIFVSYYLFDGVEDIFTRWSADKALFSNATNGGVELTATTWVTYILLGMSAIMFLPRQFHIAVVENSHEKHIETAKWLFPLYMFLINLFVLPIALVGLMKGLSPDKADMFVLNLPLQFGSPWLVLLVFIGGFSAATSMVMISSMTMATMITNHLLLPILDLLPWFGSLRQQVLKFRWLAVASVILLGYSFEKVLGGSYTLVNMGIISFAAAFQFAPIIIGGIYWRKGSQVGAILGLGAGFLTWFYTLLLPTFVRSGWIATDLLKYGPWGLRFLNPEQLFGLSGLPTLTHCVFWSFVFNAGLYILGSLMFPDGPVGREIAETFVGFQPAFPTAGLALTNTIQVNVNKKKKKLIDPIKKYLGQERAEEMIARCLSINGLAEKKQVSVLELAEFCSKLEKLLAGSLGTTIAFKTLKAANMYTPRESRELTAIYGKMLADLKIRPEELKQKIDYYKEREALVSAHAADLESKVKELEKQIIEREKVEEALKESEEKYRVLYYHSEDAILVIGPEKTYINANPAAVKLFGFNDENELQGKTPTDLSPLYQADGDKSEDKAVELMEEAMARGSQYFEWKHKKVDGSEFFSTVLLAKMQFKDKTVLQETVRDITARVQAEKELRQAQKMETVGTLAGGLAHDFNNVLGGIMATLSLISHKMNRRGQIDKEKLMDYISMMTASSHRAADMIKQLLTLSRRQELSTAPVDLNLTIKHVMKIVANTCDKSITLDPLYQKKPAMVEADPSQLEQVLLNLCVNAEHAMTIMRPEGEKWGGTMTVATERIKADRHFRATHPKAVATDYWILSVKDTGIGMSVTESSKVFDPFYTTKEQGKGTGLGLSMVYNSIKQHNGFIEVYSEQGTGTTFNSYLPVLSREMDQSYVKPDEISVPKREGLILVVEDEEAMRMACRDILEECGYHIILAENGEDGVTIFTERHQEINAVLLDMSMPKMSGKEAYIKMKQIDPKIKVLLVSGLKQDDRVKDVMNLGVRHFLQKPFTLRKLATAMEETVNE